jgi:hypothetical protein
MPNFYRIHVATSAIIIDLKILFLQNFLMIIKNFLLSMRKKCVLELHWPLKFECFHFSESSFIFLCLCFVVFVYVYSVFHPFRQAKFSYGGSILSLSQCLLLPQLPLKTKLAIKEVKIDSKIIISLTCSKSAKQTAYVCCSLFTFDVDDFLVNDHLEKWMLQLVSSGAKMHLKIRFVVVDAVVVVVSVVVGPVVVVVVNDNAWH